MSARPPIQIIQLQALDGPNRHRPQPCVYALVGGVADPRELIAVVKDAAQRVGVVIGQLAAEAVALAEAPAAQILFSTPTPALGAELVRHAAETLQATRAGDESWDADAQLMDLQRRRRAEALPIAALQILAEAAARQIPAFVRRDGQLQIGYGARGAQVPVARHNLLGADSIGVAGQPRPQHAAPIDWGRLGAIPVLALVGVAPQAAEEIARRWRGVPAIGPCGFDQARDALCDPSADALALALDPRDLGRRGLPLTACAACVILGLGDGDVGEGGAGRALEAGLPLLVTEPGGVAILAGAPPELAALADYAPCRVVWATRDTSPAEIADALGGR